MKIMTRLLSATALAAMLGCSSSSHDVTVNWNNTKQTMDGFGASSAFFGGNITDDVADQLFDAKKGIGISLLRTMIGVPSDTMSDGSEPTTGAVPTPTAPELTTAQQCMLRGCQVWAASWTPPPIWKTTNSKYGSGTGFATNTLDPAHYQDFANYLGQYVDILAAAKPPVPVFGLSPVNEPDYVATWDNAQWTGDTMTTFIGQYMGPLFAQKYPTVKIIAPETANCPNCDKYITPLLADPAASAAVSIMATHDYGSSIGNYDKPRKAGKPFWETEWSQENAMGDTPDPSMTSALAMAKQMHADIVTSGLSAWNWWAIYITEDGLNDNTRLNPAFIQPDATMSAPYMFKRGYVFGNWSKFVRPSFQRIDATEKPTGGVLAEAYRDATHLAIIAINTNTATVTQKFILSGNTLGTITPWITSADHSLEAGTPISATDTFTFDLPAQSVVTFVNWDATTETPDQTLPPQPDGGADGPTKINTGLDCTMPVVPGNVVSGGVTDFTDWSNATGKWGSSQNLFGAIYSYAGPKGSTMSANVDITNDDLHGTGSVTQGDYGGIGLSFSVCATVTSFSQIQFTVSGSSPGCDMELQIKTFDQQPSTQTPPGGCDPTNPNGCYNFPVVKKVAVPSATPTTVTTPLTSFSSWSATNAAQVVGLQWQFTGTNISSDAGADAVVGCPIDVAVTGIKFLP
jgi:glucuronoarabinoxylan endo-1,4-beta-xylanase